MHDFLTAKRKSRVCNIAAVYFYFPCHGIGVLPHCCPRLHYSTETSPYLRHRLTLSLQQANSISVETLKKGLLFPLHVPNRASASLAMSMRLAIQASPILHTSKAEDLENGKQYLG